MNHRDPKRSSNKSDPQVRRAAVLTYETLELRQLLAGDVCYAPTLLWSQLPEVKTPADQVHIRALESSQFDLEEQSILAVLSEAPIEYSESAVAPATLTIPNPDGVFESFAIVESSILEPDLAAKFPNIKTYRGQGIDNPAATIRLDYTDQGFHAQVLAPDNGDYFIDPLVHLETDVYTSYYVHDALVRPGNDFAEIGVDTEHLPDYNMDDAALLSVAAHHEMVSHDDGPCTCPMCTAAREVQFRDSGDNPDDPSFAPDFGDQLRTYRLAVAATGEYTAFHGGTVSAGMSAIVTTMNRVNGLYENDLGVRMVLVGNNDQLIYTNANTDPYTNNNGFTMLGENQANVDAVIGNANYDIGHVFSTGGGGVASLGSVGVDGAKARGVTGQGSPIGDPFDVDYVAHEMGHQYGGNHTFNGDSGSCAGGNRNGSTAYEPGSGTTIQAYAGICGNDNLQPNSDAMFHSLSIDEIRDHVTTGVGNAAAAITNTGNSIPTVDAGANFVIPSETPFELTAIGSDADAGNVLTYSWEERDLGVQQDVSDGDNGSSPIFRTWDPTASPTRSFPRMQDLIDGTTSIGETLPTTDRTMNFRVVLRDNASGGGGVVSDDMTVNVNPTGAAFAVTSQNNATSWNGSTQQTISWNVAGTTANGIDTANVDIFFSADGGITFETVLASGVANDGSHDITVPDIATTQGRIKVKGAGNIFFDINDADIEIVDAGPAVLLSQSGGTTSVAEGGATDSYEISLSTIPAGAVTIEAMADVQTELSLDGTNYSSSVSVVISDTTPVEVFVRAIDDTVEEGAHSSTITHQITASNDPADYPTSTTIPDVVVAVADDDKIDPVFVGVDFDDSAGDAPENWTEINGGPNATFGNLRSELGNVTGFDLSISVEAGAFSDFESDPITSTIPQHSVSLSNIDGQIYTGGAAIDFVWSDLDPDLDYEIYVFAVDDFFDSIEQAITVVGDDSSSFEQRFTKGQLIINDQVGSSAQTLSDYGLLVGADSNGEISISINPITGTSDVVVGGLAILEVANSAPTDITLSENELAENTDTSAGDVEVGLLTATDSDSTAFTYSLVAGEGDADNADFEIVGDSLRIKQGTMVDFETQASYLIRVEVSDGANTYAKQLSVAVTDEAETSTLVIGGGTSQRSMLNSVEIAFDGIVSFGATPFELLKRGTDGGAVDITQTVDNSSGETVVTLTFAGAFAEASGSLVNGNYQLTVFGGQVQTLSGQDFDGDGDGITGGNFVFGDTASDAFFRLFGDADGGRHVNLFDLLPFRNSYLSAAGDDEFDERFDSNNDGDINALDLLKFRLNWLERVDFE